MQALIQPDMSGRHYRDKILKTFENSIDWEGCILDVGCGDAMLWTTDYFRRKAEHVVALDLVLHSEWKKVKATNIDYIVGDACNLPFRQQTFSMVFEKDMLHHVNDPERALDEICRVSKGKIILAEANRHNPISFVHMVKLRGHQHFSREKFMSMVRLRAVSPRFSFIEAHYFPVKSPFLTRLFVIMEEILERFLVKSLRSYNIAVVGTHVQMLKSTSNE